MDVKAVMDELKLLGTETTKKTFINHGAKEPLYGVLVGDLKKIVKKVRKNNDLAIDLWGTGNSDARYLAGLIADEEHCTKEQLNRWSHEADWYMLSDYAVAGVTAESPYGWDLGLQWIDSDRELTISAGWNTLINVISIKPDQELDIKKISALLEIVKDEIHRSLNRVRYSMNGFIIATGSFIPELTHY